MQVKAKDLLPGDKVDLEHDPFHADDPVVEFEYGKVGSVTAETEDCILVEFENVSSAAYPADNLFDVIRQVG
jgi:ribosomal protein L21E